MANMIVGFSSVVLLGYSLMLIGIHIFIPHPSVTKKVINLSYASLSLLALAQACIVGTYFIPHISGACICNGLWSAALVFYVVGLYTLKFVYVERIAILNKHPMLASKKIQKWIKIITGSLMTSCFISVVMMIVLTDGECHEDPMEYGCKPSFHVADVYLAIIMIMCDAALFAGFCYKWWGLIKVFKLSSDSQMLVEMIQSFSFQFILTVSAMLSCVVDGIVNLWYPGYSTLIIFCVDCAVVSSCDFAMIKESQAFMWKYVCWPCRMPSFLLRGNGVTRLHSQTSNTTKTMEPSKTGASTTEKTVNVSVQSGLSDQAPSDRPKISMVSTNSTHVSNSSQGPQSVGDNTPAPLSVAEEGAEIRQITPAPPMQTVDAMMAVEVK